MEKRTMSIPGLISLLIYPQSGSLQSDRTSSLELDEYERWLQVTTWSVGVVSYSGQGKEHFRGISSGQSFERSETVIPQPRKGRGG